MPTLRCAGYTTGQVTRIYFLEISRLVEYAVHLKVIQSATQCLCRPHENTFKDDLFPSVANNHFEITVLEMSTHGALSLTFEKKINHAHERTGCEKKILLLPNFEVGKDMAK